MMDDSAIMFDEIIDAEAKSNSEETKTVLTNFIEQTITCKTQNFFFICIFINYYRIIDTC